MLKNPQDRRAKRTAMQIKECMFSLMEHKAIHEVSVAEICRACQINRATFYDHCRDVFDLVQDMEGDILIRLRELMDSVTPEDTPSQEVSRLFFAFLRQHRLALRLLLNGERSREFSRRLDEQIMPFFEGKARQNYIVPADMEREFQFALRFAATGYYRFFLQSMESGEEDYGEEARVCAMLSDASLSCLFERKQERLGNQSEL